jgi:excisionase family DNA binding protein
MTNLISIAEAQSRLSLSRSTINRMLDRGDIRRLHFGRAVRIPAEDIEALLQSVGGSK